MAKSQYISWATVLLILSGTSIVAQASSIDNQPKSLQIAQKNSDDEMIDAIQRREKKVESGLNKIRKLTGTEKKGEPEPQEEDLDPEETIDALQNRQKKIENKETLEALQGKNLNIESLEELEVVRNVIENPDFSEEEMLGILQGQDIEIENLEQLKQLQKMLVQKESLIPESGISSQMAF